jgi:hypothetical protein
MIDHALRQIVLEYAPEEVQPEEWDLYALRQRLVLDYFLVVEELPATEGGEHEFEAVEDSRSWSSRRAGPASAASSRAGASTATGSCRGSCWAPSTRSGATTSTTSIT